MWFSARLISEGALLRRLAGVCASAGCCRMLMIRPGTGEVSISLLLETLWPSGTGALSSSAAVRAATESQGTGGRSDDEPAPMLATLLVSDGGGSRMRGDREPSASSGECAESGAAAPALAGERDIERGASGCISRGLSGGSCGALRDGDRDAESMDPKGTGAAATATAMTREGSSCSGPSSGIGRGGGKAAG